MAINNVEHVLYIAAGQLCNTEKARTRVVCCSSECSNYNFSNWLQLHSCFIWEPVVLLIIRFLRTSYLHSYACHVSIITLHKSIMTGLLPVLAQKF